MAQQVKDPGLSLLWLWFQLWHRFDPWAQEPPHAPGVAKKKKNTKLKLMVVMAAQLRECPKTTDLSTL